MNDENYIENKIVMNNLVNECNYKRMKVTDVLCAVGVDRDDLRNCIICKMSLSKEQRLKIAKMLDSPIELFIPK